ncbi:MULTISPECIES: RimK family alpha-L-glutamate ligase [unclassified Streptomyces]|uniref:ATP-grasp domain-containing protein n=1 Tax=unclassified Streptomyces TaxID=2593676 RepID=UPI002258D804|nr:MULTISPECIES: RimK family alpha-L-glutamate ligase [unclassified Streptomyces]MCX5144109.1 RimK family alpha-L-glutamate ligase [Streptomyces sp. NBC_00338]WSU62444.1 RimK family alpha-L-glutamate ligase [Streptomyces sp. NBC_01104]
MPVGVLLSTVRYEERRLLSELERRDVTVLRLDARAMSFGPKDTEGLRGMTVLNREISSQRAALAAESLEAFGARPLNDASATRVCGNKWSTYLRLTQCGVPTPVTLLAPTPETGREAIASIGYPAVIKPLSSSWGNRVGLITDQYAADAVLETCAALPSAVARTVIVQEAVRPGSPDIRGIVVDGVCLGLITRSGGDWRNNVARGATVEQHAPDEELGRLCVRAAAAVGARIAGVDLVERADGAHTVIEVNSRVEFQGFERATGVDVAARMVEACTAEMIEVKEPV